MPFRVSYIQSEIEVTLVLYTSDGHIIFLNKLLETGQVVIPQNNYLNLQINVFIITSFLYLSNFQWVKQNTSLFSGKSWLKLDNTQDLKVSKLKVTKLWFDLIE